MSRFYGIAMPFLVAFKVSRPSLSGDGGRTFPFSNATLFCLLQIRLDLQQGCSTTEGRLLTKACWLETWLKIMFSLKRKLKQSSSLFSTMPLRHLFCQLWQGILCETIINLCEGGNLSSSTSSPATLPWDSDITTIPEQSMFNALPERHCYCF